MTSDEIFDVIEQIAATPGKNDKISIMSAYKDDADFRRVLQAAYDPFKTYGIAKMPDYEPQSVGSGHSFGEDTWLLLQDLECRRLTGNAARDAVARELSKLTPASAELLKRIIKKDLRAGFTDGTINKVIKGLIPTFPYMRCCLPKDAKLDQFDWQGGVISQEKADGMFANVDHDYAGCVHISSRQGTPFPLDELDDLVAEIKATFPKGYQVHGELIVMQNGAVLPREQGNGVLNSIAQGGKLEAGQEVHLFAWDQIPLAAVKPKGKYEVPYKTRFSGLVMQLKQRQGQNKLLHVIPTKIVHSLDEAYAHYRDFLARGKEGTIIKDPKAIWRDGTSKQQVKLKLEVEVDLKIVGFLEGNGKNATTFGSIIARTSDDLLEVCVSGMTDAMRAKIHAERDQVIGKILTVKANSIMAPSEEGKLYSLFLPRFVEIRSDKTEADSLQRVRDQFEAAVTAA